MRGEQKDWDAASCHVDPAVVGETCLIREKKLKGWRRSRKIALIEQTNPPWFDLSDDWEQQPKFYDRLWKTEKMK